MTVGHNQVGFLFDVLFAQRIQILTDHHKWHFSIQLDNDDKRGKYCLRLAPYDGRPPMYVNHDSLYCAVSLMVDKAFPRYSEVDFALLEKAEKEFS